MIKKYSIVLTILLLLLQSCDGEKYLNSNLSQRKNAADSMKVNGFLLRMDNNAIIKNGYIRVSYNSTKSDSLGRFVITIPISRDNNRNLKEPFIITAPGYEDYIDFLYITPGNQRMDIQMIYAVPILEQGQLDRIEESGSSGEYRFSVWVKDYQGFDDVQSVTAEFKEAEKREFTTVVLYRKDVIDQYSAIWGSDIFIGQLETKPSGKIFVYFTAVDKAGHVGRKYLALL